MVSKFEKFLYSLTTMLVAMLLLVILAVIMLSSCKTTLESEEQIDVQGIGKRPLTPYLTSYFAEVDDDAWAILIDLDDRANWPHVLTNKIILKQVQIGGDLSDVAHWHNCIGVVTDIATDGVDIEWIYSSVRVRANQFDFDWTLPEHGLSLSVVGDTLDRVLTSELTTTVAITSGTNLPSPLGAADVVTVTAEVGDLILFTQETITGSTLHLFVETSYDTE